MKFELKYGCNKCGKYAEMKLDSMTSFTRFNDEELPEYLRKICTCEKEAKK